MSTAPGVAKLSYYNYGPLLSYNATYNVCVGGRGLGKTFGAKERSLKNWFKSREQFFYLRRYKDEISKAGPTFFDDLAYKFPYADFRTVGGLAQTASAETRGLKKREWDTVGFFGALSVAQQFKSVPFPRVTTLLYDEFIIETGNTQYLRDEVTKFNNHYATIDRWNDRLKVFMLANSVSMNNPYFIEWRIRPDEGREFQTAFKGFVAVHFPDARQFQSEVYATKFGQFIQESSPDYAEYAVGNVFADAHDELIARKTANARYRFTVESRSGTFSVWKDSETGLFYGQRKRPNLERIFTLDRNRVTVDRTFIDFNSPVLSPLRASFNTGRVWFDEPSTRNAFIEIFKR